MTSRWHNDFQSTHSGKAPVHTDLNAKRKPRLLDDNHIEGVSGVSLPMLLRVLTGRNGSGANKLRGAVERALSGGAEGVVHMNSDRCLDA